MISPQNIFHTAPYSLPLESTVFQLQKQVKPVSTTLFHIIQDIRNICCPYIQFKHCLLPLLLSPQTTDQGYYNSFLTDLAAITSALSFSSQNTWVIFFFFIPVSQSSAQNSNSSFSLRLKAKVHTVSGLQASYCLPQPETLTYSSVSIRSLIPAS